MTLAYVPNNLTKDETELSVEINGKFYKANVQAKPLYDPDGKKMRG